MNEPTERKMIEELIPYNFQWEGSNIIEQIEKDIQAVKEMGADEIQVRAEESYGCAYLLINAVKNRPETDEEYQNRIDAYVKQKAESEEKERQEFKRLWDKFGGTA